MFSKVSGARHYDQPDVDAVIDFNLSLEGAACLVSDEVRHLFDSETTLKGPLQDSNVDSPYMELRVASIPHARLRVSALGNGKINITENSPEYDNNTVVPRLRQFWQNETTRRKV